MKSGPPILGVYYIQDYIWHNIVNNKISKIWKQLKISLVIHFTWRWGDISLHITPLCKLRKQCNWKIYLISRMSPYNVAWLIFLPSVKGWESGILKIHVTLSSLCNEIVVCKIVTIVMTTRTNQQGCSFSTFIVNSTWWINAQLHTHYCCLAREAKSSHNYFYLLFCFNLFPCLIFFVCV